MIIAEFAEAPSTPVRVVWHSSETKAIHGVAPAADILIGQSVFVLSWRPTHELPQNGDRSSYLLMNRLNSRQGFEHSSRLTNTWAIENRRRPAKSRAKSAPDRSFGRWSDSSCGILWVTFTLLLLLAATPLSAIAQLVMTAESPGFSLDTRLSVANDTSVVVVTAVSPAFTLDTRLAAGNPTPSPLLVKAESGVFTLGTLLAVPFEALIVPTVSPAFELNTMWIGIRNTAGMQLELSWSTNAPGFHPQWAAPPLRPSMQWQDMTNSVSESGGLYRVQINPEGTDRYFRLKL